MKMGLMLVCFWLFAVCLAGEVKLPVEGSADEVKDEAKKENSVKKETSIKYETDPEGNNLELDFSLDLKSVSDPDLLFSHFANRKLVIFYFSVKCKHCTNAFPYIKQLAEDLGQKEVRIIAIAVKNNKEDDIRNFIRKNDTGIPVFHDSNKKFSSLYGTGRIPLVVAVNQHSHYLKYQKFDGNKTPDKIMELYSKSGFTQ